MYPTNVPNVYSNEFDYANILMKHDQYTLKNVLKLNITASVPN